MDVRIDVVDANELILNQYLSLFWYGNGEVSPVLKHVYASCLLYDHTFHGLRDCSRHSAGVEMSCKYAQSQGGVCAEERTEHVRAVQSERLLKRGLRIIDVAGLREPSDSALRRFGL